MSFLIYIIQKIFSFIYLFFKLFPCDDRILFISRQNDKPSIDYRFLIKEINKRSNNKIVVITKRIEKNYFIALRKNFLIMFKQMYHLARCGICIVDGYNVAVSFLKHKKNLKIFQLWHALGAIKKFGYQTMTTNKSLQIANVCKLHKNYNYIIASSDYEIPFLMDAFGYERKYFYTFGLPRVDYLLRETNKNRKKIYKKYPEFINRKVILYAPTFRNNNDYRFEKLINIVNYNDYVLIIKKHENINYKISDLKSAYLIDDFSTLQLLSITNYLITDYSAVSIEAAILNIPIFIWAYDYENYKKYPGLNVDLKKEFSLYFSEDINKIYKQLNKKYDLNVVTDFKNKNVKYLDKKITRRLIDFIFKESNYE